MDNNRPLQGASVASQPQRTGERIDPGAFGGPKGSLLMEQGLVPMRHTSGGCMQSGDRRRDP